MRRSLRPLFYALALFVTAQSTSSYALESHLLIDPDGEHNADFFGTSAAWAGDVNADGYDDVLVGAFRFPRIGSIGRAYLFFGGAAIDTVADLIIDPPSGGAGWFGISVAPAGDFNGDNYSDFIVGAQQAGNEGRAFIYYGGPALDATADLTLVGETTGALNAFGASVAPAGDVNEDGFDDVIVGAPSYPGGGNKYGRAYVYFGGATPDAVADRTFTGVGFFDQLGTVVGGAGDINGDGHPDVLASAPGNRDVALNAGALYVWFGGPAFDTTADLTVHGSGLNQHLMNSANAGDVNNDGFSDLIAAEKDHVYVWFGGAIPNTTADLTLTKSFTTVCGGGDVNGDGIADFVIGDQYAAPGGRVSVFYGGSSVDNVEDLYFVGNEPAVALGQGVAGGGHVDGAGPSDLITTAFYDPDAIGYSRGRVFVFANSIAPTGVSPALTTRLAQNYPNPFNPATSIPFSLARAGRVTLRVYDVNGAFVSTLLDEYRDAGAYVARWDGNTHAGNIAPAGVYFARLEHAGSTETRKITLLK